MTTSSPAVPPLLPVVKHPGLLGICAAAGLALGLTAAAVTPTEYTAEARLAVGTGEVSNLAVPGYPTASADMASNYARWVTAQGAGGQQLAADGVELSASPIPASNVIRLEAVSQDSEAAVASADRAAEALVAEVNKVRDVDDPDKILEQITAATPEVAELEQRQIVLANAYRDALARAQAGEITDADTVALRDQYTEANARWEEAQIRQQGLEGRYNRIVGQGTTEVDLQTIQPAEVTSDSRASNFQRFGLVGLVGGAAIGFVAAHLRFRRGRKAAANESTSTAAPTTTAARTTTEARESR